MRTRSLFTGALTASCFITALHAVYTHDIKFALAIAALGIALIRLVKLEFDRDDWFMLSQAWRDHYEKMRDLAYLAIHTKGVR